MKALVLFLVTALVSLAASYKSHGVASSVDYQDCTDNYKDVTYDYRLAMYDFTVELYKAIATRGEFHFICSPHSVWIILAAVAEGADEATQQQIFQLLNIPKDKCTRQKYYKLASSRLASGYDVSITNARTIVVDQELKMNYDWFNFITKNSLLDILSSPIKKYPQIAANDIRRVIHGALPRLNLDGNSVLLDAVEYSGLWTTAFEDAIFERAPFYNQLGQKIGTVDLMKVKRRVRMAYIPSINAKIVELPIGLNGRYRMFIALNLDRKEIKPIADVIAMPVILEILSKLKESNIPIEVAIPRFSMVSEIDLRTILEDMGVSSIWTNPAATRLISEPPALPSSFVQRANLTLSTHGLNPSPPLYDLSSNSSTGLNENIGRDFIANRPFFFSIMDAETNTVLMTAAYSKPMYT